MQSISLKKGKEEAVKRYHPWIFSGAIQTAPKDLSEGEIVAVLDCRGVPLGVGYYAHSNIAVRMLSFEPCEIDGAFWQNKIRKAYDLRRQLGLTDDPMTTCYRLIHGEGDGLPGLIIDYYDGAFVLQCHTAGMHRQTDAICSALISVYGDKLRLVYDKSRETLPREYMTPALDAILYPTSPAIRATDACMVHENSHSFVVDWEKGQKTGFFLDQRDNRQLLGHYAHGKSVLNTFCYSGGFSVYALSAGARMVHSVDSSPPAIALADRNAGLVSKATGEHQTYRADVLEYLKQADRTYEIVVVDPPAYAKNISKRHNAVQGYRRLNEAAIRCVAPGGLLFTFSCSQAVDRSLFYHTIVAAALDAGRNIRVLHHLSQAPDHPVSLFHPEGEYLKGLVLYVE